MLFDDLPLEIIQRIFTFCCGAVMFEEPSQTPGTRTGATQVTLSLVCSRWREVALNTSELWGDVAVEYHAGEREPQSAHNWLNRAGMTPISLSISVFRASESQVAAISQILLSSFHVTSLDVGSFYSFLLVPTNNLSRLERLKLTLYKPERTTNNFPRLSEMPSLKALDFRMDLDNFVDITNVYLIPWHQLRVFRLRQYYWPSQMLLNILQQCKSLVLCNVLVELEDGQHEHEHDIVLPHLENLSLNMDGEGNAGPFIRSLTLPNLRSLEIRSFEWSMKPLLDPKAIIIMAQRSGFNKLTDLSLCLTAEQPVDVRSLLGSMPALERVQLYEPLMFQPGTFDELSSGTIGPQLEEIRFGVMSDEEIGLLLETVGHRHKKAKTVSNIRPFASVTCCASESEISLHHYTAQL
ncbi:hypothetical protein M378DRAFT_25286 [Amanita muscaria Koide BX008]|uniref:F-box domain-containing protein n=1 Tax=Amanita muscaria (strain Koide BX008) TaxID=946122 RepID=A0A0C2SIT0_AMAMK|nr:hypothetical protein M378DRAFT_25286 [Amanita muscaria Koide BX008]